MKFRESKKCGNGLIILSGMMLAMIAGCSTQPVCPEEDKQVAGNTVAVSGPANLKVGERATLSIGVTGTDSICIKEVTALMQNIKLDTLFITSKLHYTPVSGSGNCSCKTEGIVYTLLYFTPTTPGTYTFIAGPGSVTNLEPAENYSFFTINVEQ